MATTHTYKPLSNIATIYQYVDLVQCQTAIQHLIQRPISLKKTQQRFEEYAAAVVAEAYIGIMQSNTMQQKLNLVPLAWERIRRYTGRAKDHLNKDAYVADAFLANEILIRRITTGSNLTQEKSQMTAIIPLEFLVNIATTEEIAEAAYGCPYCADDHNSKTLIEMMQDPNNVDMCRIDQRSLAAFIAKTQREVPNNQAHKQRLDYNLQQAKIFAAIAEVHGGIPQVIRESDFGRRYYTGPNLQSATRELRHAALGTCYQYDIKTSVYAWKLDAAKDILREEKIPGVLSYTLEYIDQRNYHRRRLANILAPMLGISIEKAIDIIKGMFTAIGFGAGATTNGWWVNGEYQRPALNTIIKNPEALKTILADDFVQNFIDEQKVMNELIFWYAKKICGDDLKKKPRLLDKAKHLNKNRVLAFLYQSTERAWVDGVKQIINRYDPTNEILLTVHDGFYTRKPAPLLEMREYLRQQNAYSDIEKTEINAWSDLQEYDAEVEEHKKFIEQQEQEAREFFDTVGDLDLISGSSSNLSAQAKQFQKQMSAPMQKPRDGFYDGSGYDGSNYDPDSDPWFQDLDKETQQQVVKDRERILGVKKNASDNILQELLAKRDIFH